MCNKSVSKTYLSKRLSPLGAIGMEILDNVEGKHHQCAMYNLYNSSTFFKSAYNHKKKVLIHGVTRKGMRLIPPCIKQDGFNSNRAQIDTRGTARETVLKGDTKLTKLVEASVYDNKTVHYTIMVSEELKWAVKEKD